LYQNVNPFFYRGPIRQASHFIDREEETARLLALLRNLQNVAILGQRRIGKTSLLFHIAQPEIYTTAGLSEHAAIFVYVDGQEMGGLSDAETRSFLAQQIVNALPSNEIQEIRSSEITHRDFRDLVEQTTALGFSIFLIIDEFEALAANPALTPSFFSSLRALSNQFNLVFVTASYRSLFDLTYARADTLSSPFFNTFAHFNLGLFTEDAAEGLIRTLAENASIMLPAVTIQRIVTLAGPHPFFLQMAAYHACEVLAEMGEDGISGKDWQSRFKIEATPHFEYYWNHLSGENQFILAALPFHCQEDTSSLHFLHEAALLRRGVFGWTYLSPVLERFVRNQSVPGLLQFGPFVIDTAARRATGSEGPLKITKTEFDALAYFMKNADRVVSQEELETAVWGDEYIEDPDRLRSVIKNLRKALDTDAVQLATKWGEGFILREATPERKSE
jgi:hypothetical protein